VNIYSIAIISPWGRGCPLFVQFESPLPKDDLCQLWLKLAQRFCRKVENVSLTDRRTDRLRTTDDQKSSLELKIQRGAKIVKKD
jgi:hypothetical protein